MTGEQQSAFMVKITNKDTASQEEQLFANHVQERGSKQESDSQRKIEEAEKKAAENYDKYMRAVAELDNFKKRAAKDKAEAIAYGNEKLIKDVLPILDSLERASEHACNSADIEAFKEGFKLVKDQLLCCLGKHGVEKIEAVGADFNPHLHDALLQVESEKHDDSKVVEEFEKGYLLHGRLLKPAKVSVARSSKKEDKKDTSALIDR